MTTNMTPRSHSEIVFPSAETAQLVDDLISNRLEFPAHGKNGLLIYGPNGTGKTSLAKLLPDELEKARTGYVAYSPEFHSVTAGNNGVGLIGHIARVAENIALNFSFHYFILDEVDNLGPAAMLSLKSVMDRHMTVFIMTTNNLSAVERGVRSRSHLIDMTAPPPEAWLPRCRETLLAHGISKQPSDDALLPLIAACNGDAREILTEMRKLALELA